MLVSWKTFLNEFQKALEIKINEKEEKLLKSVIGKNISFSFFSNSTQFFFFCLKNLDPSDTNSVNQFKFIQFAQSFGPLPSCVPRVIIFF